MPLFQRYVGIDYSGAETPDAKLPGLRVYLADEISTPREILPQSAVGRWWTRRGIAEWLVERLLEQPPTLVGINHGFSFPLQYFETHDLPLDWAAFLEDFRRHWPTDDDNTYVDFIREGVVGSGAARAGDTRWRRLTECCAGRGKSLFHFQAPGSVAKATHAGLPWLRYLRERALGRSHFWPFDGWETPPGRSVVAEVYPALWKRTYPREERNQHQHDAYSTVAWLRSADRDGRLAKLFAPRLAPADRAIAQIEGWILGVAGSRSDDQAISLHNMH